MTNTTIETRNLDQYGNAALQWSQARDLLARESRLSATTIQTVGAKGYDGFTLALVV